MSATASIRNPSARCGWHGDADHSQADHLGDVIVAAVSDPES